MNGKVAAYVFAHDDESANPEAKVLGDLLPPRRENAYHAAMTGPGQKALARFLSAAGDFAGYRSLLLDLKGRADEAFERWALLHGIWNRERAEAAAAARKFNETHVETALLNLWQERERRLAALDEIEKGLTKALSAERLVAAKAFADAGIAFVPQDPAAAYAAAGAALTDAATAARLKLPWTTRGPGWLALLGFAAAKAAVGCLLGAALLTLPGYVHISGINEAPPARIAVTVIIGVALIALGSKGVESAVHWATESRRLEEPLAVRAGKLAFAWVAASTIVAMDTAIEAKGLIARDDLLSAVSSSQSRTSLTWMIALGAVVSVVYVLYAAMRGATAPSAAVQGRVALSREEEARTARSEGRNDARLVAALASSNRIAALGLEVEEVVARRAEVGAEFARRQAAVEARRRPEETDLPEPRLKVLGQLLRESRGRTREYDAWAHAFLRRTEGRLRPPFWWLWRWWWR